jgi:hypothetical protein
MKSIFHILSFLHTLPLPLVSSPPLTVPILQSWFLLLIFNLMLKGCLNVCPLWVYWTMVHSTTPSIILSYLFTSHPPFFNSFQYTSLYPQTLLLLILLMLYHSLLLSLFPQVP